MQEQTTSITMASVKAAPPVAVTFTEFILGIPLADWVQFATLVYVALQIFIIVRDQFKKRRDRRSKS